MAIGVMIFNLSSDLENRTLITAVRVALALFEVVMLGPLIAIWMYWAGRSVKMW